MDGSLHQYNVGHCSLPKIYSIAYIRRFGMVVILPYSGKLQEFLLVFRFNINGDGFNLGYFEYDATILSTRPHGRHLLLTIA
jgi:hypothetical protein